MMVWLFLLYFLGALVLIATVLPLWRTTFWWVRIWDFPRFQIAVLAFVVCIVWPFARWPTSIDGVFLIAVAAAFGWQVSWIWRYLPAAPREVGQVRRRSCSSATTIVLLTTNVLQTNRYESRLLRIIVDTDPDVVFAVETDEWWCSKLAAALQSSYPYQLKKPLSNGYGLALFSRLELVEPEIRFVVDKEIPSIRTGVKLAGGAVIELYCEHPRPPALQQDSTHRDIELVLVAQEIRLRGRPAVLLGDLNDVAWSSSTVQFMRTGGLLDPRRGRGFFSTYPAGLPGFRYPVDHVFNTAHFEIAEMRVLPKCGSDHLPLLAALQLRSDPSARERICVG